MAPENFGPDWLAARIAALVPAYPDVSLCVALSGGVDSTALLGALAASRSTFPRVRALHVDHGLRPAAKEWARHCRSLARLLRVPLKVLTTRVERGRGESLEAAAREARYRLLASALAPGEVLLPAHHCDDQLETVLLQLFRGSGLPGLADVDPARYCESLSAKTLRTLPAERRRNARRFWITRAVYLAPDTRRLEEVAGALLNARPDANPFVQWGGGVRVQR